MISAAALVTVSARLSGQSLRGDFSHEHIRHHEPLSVSPPRVLGEVNQISLNPVVRPLGSRLPQAPAGPRRRTALPGPAPSSGPAARETPAGRFDTASAGVAWISRWSGLLAVASPRAYAASLLELSPAAELGEGPRTELHEVLADSRGGR